MTKDPSASEDVTDNDNWGASRRLISELFFLSYALDLRELLEMCSSSRKSCKEVSSLRDVSFSLSFWGGL